jgi:hypothetical protein
MGVEDFFDLAREELLAATVDDLLAAAGDPGIACRPESPRREKFDDFCTPAR